MSRTGTPELAYGKSVTSGDVVHLEDPVPTNDILAGKGHPAPVTGRPTPETRGVENFNGWNPRTLEPEDPSPSRVTAVVTKASGKNLSHRNPNRSRGGWTKV